ncbi:MAG: carbamoyltransferase HypF [Candidatus Bipolaricaulis sp.]|nr:carbamoyltransferase HypF [Candidatus Bipolaricaulis sp.]
MIARRRILVRGVVQGVGFRPFVYRTAVALGLGGTVCNRGDSGVEILVEGGVSAIDAFVVALRRDAPPLASVDGVSVEEVVPVGESRFTISPSQGEGRASGTIPPDTAICPACLGEVRGSTRYSGYWATSCTDCGPRFTIIEELPYDRPRTAMRDYPLCPACEAEYLDPANRRYHAESTACPVCGPRLLFDGSGDEPIRRATMALANGKILAIKGIGGTHLACDATEGAAVELLRRRLGRGGQPFAVMASEAMVPSFAVPDEREWELLRRPERPIVAVRQRDGALPAAVAPGLHTVGAMLPYTALHALLFERLRGPLVMTSANRPGRPMWIEDEEIARKSVGIADHRLTHDRRIVARCDDSVVRRAGGRTVFLRRSRGYTPARFPVDLGREPILALGPETGLTFALYDAGGLTMSQHIGSVDNLETYAYLEEAVEHLRRLLGVATPRVVVCDAHPRFLTTSLAERMALASGGKAVRVQHHVAHVAAAMAEHHLEEAVGVVLDGYGYGADGSAWGGEILVSRGGTVERAASLRPIRLPGGDLATRFPLRVAAAYLAEGGVPLAEIEGALRKRGLSPEAAALVVRQWESGVNTPQTTSAGRFLDGIAAWLGVCRQRTYEGEPAMRLEALAARGTALAVDVPVRRAGSGWVIDLVPAFCALVEASSVEPAERIAAAAQSALARGAAAAAIAVAEERRIGTVCLSGGVAVNDAIASEVRAAMEAAGLAFVTNEWAPCGDGGVAFGQAVAAGLGWRLLEADGIDAADGEAGGRAASSWHARRSHLFRSGSGA